MFSRLVRFFKSIFGAAIQKAEDPELILKQNIRELNEKEAELNEHIAESKARMKSLNSKREKAEERVNKIERFIKKSLERGDEETAKEYARKLERAEDELDRITEAYNKTENAYETLKENKSQILNEVRKKRREAEKAIRDHRLSETMGETADAMEQFEVGGLDQTHDEMINRLEQQTSKSEARMEVALDSVDGEEEQNLLESAEEQKAEEIVSQFKEEMEKENATELDAEPATNDEGSQLLTDEGTESDTENGEMEEESEAEKTIGRVNAEAL